MTDENKGFFSKIKLYFKNMKKSKIIIALVLCVAIIGGVVVTTTQKDRMVNGNNVAAVGFTRTLTLSEGSLENSISSSGVVASANISTVTTDLNYSVAEIYVSVGDSVSSGDIICKLDTSSILEQIETQQEKADENVQRYYDLYLDKVTVFNTAKETANKANTALETAKTEYETKKAEYDTVLASISSYQTAYDNANNNVLNILNQNQAKETEIANLLNVLNTAIANRDSLDTADENYQANFDAAQLEVDTAQTNYDTAVANYDTTALDTAKNELDKASANLNTAKSTSKISTYETAVSQAQSAYTQAQNAYDQAFNAQISADNNQISAYEDYENSSDSVTLDDLYSQLDDCVLKAETSGKVTGISATVGSRVTGAVATIQDTTDLEIEISIAEYDISTVKVGMPVLITSDMTDTIYNGTLSEIAPVATGGGSSSSTFSAIVSVTEKDSQLLIGTNAMTEIVVSTITGVYTVPIDAIGENDLGESIIFVQDENDTEIYNEAVVTVGSQNDFYAEISSDNIKSGMVVRAAANPEEALDFGVTEKEDAKEQGMMGGMMMPGMSGSSGKPSGMERPSGMTGGSNRG